MSKSSEEHRQWSRQWSDDEPQEGRQQQEMEELFSAIEHETKQES